MSSSTVIGIPTDEKVFETNCIPLFVGHLGDPNVKLYGSRGKKQSGIDLIGRRDRDPGQPVGIQCKLITRGAKLTEKTIRDELAAALTIDPPLTEFYIVTTASDEPAHDNLATKLAKELRDAGRIIDIQVWGWDMMQDKIRGDAKALAAFDPDYSASTATLLALGHETVVLCTRADAHQAIMLEELRSIKAIVTVAPQDTQRSEFEQHLDGQIDQYRDLMNAGQPRTALRLLEGLDKGLAPTSSAAIRARSKANMAFMYMRLGEDEKGADLLDEAYELNPSDPKVKANHILALLLRNEVAAAWSFATQLLKEDPENGGAAALAFQTASMGNGAYDPMVIVPAGLLTELNVRVHRISFMRERGETATWWTLAHETYVNFPDDGAARRMAGDALLDEALHEAALERAGSLAADRVHLMERGIALLQPYWDEVRLYENVIEPTWIMVGYNLVTAYRALGDLDQAKVIADQMLAFGPIAPETYLSAAVVAIDRDDFPEAIRLLRSTPVTEKSAVPLMVALSNEEDWAGTLEVGTPETRELLDPVQQRMLDVLVFRARQAASPDLDPQGAVEQLLEAWPLSVSAHIAVADVYKARKHADTAAMAAKAKLLIGEESSHSDRVMFAQLSVYRDAWDDLIDVLDKHVPVDRPSEPLSWLAMAFANAAIRPRTSAFFKSLAPQVIALPAYARLAGAAENHRGDLKAAERYLLTATKGDPTDLRAHLLLANALIRDNRESEATGHISRLDDDAVKGIAEDMMRLAHHHRRAGETARALRLGYRVAAVQRRNEEVMGSYPGLVFHDDQLPAPVGEPGPAQVDFWFDLEGLEGERDIWGIIDAEPQDGVESFAPDHPLALAIEGKGVGDLVTMLAGYGAERQYRVRALKHKYLWLLHDIMATHAARFPEATNMFEVAMQDGDIQPVLDMVRRHQDKEDGLAKVYSQLQVPLVAIAATAHRSVIAVAEHLAATGTSLRTCVGAEDEREEAAQFVIAARRKGVVLDTLTLWQLRELGALEAAKRFFGRLCIARSSFDELLELRARIESNRGREYMTMGFKDGEPWKIVHTVEDSESQYEKMNAVIAQIQTNCEIMAVDGAMDSQIIRAMGIEAAHRLFDPIFLARDEGLILLSEDLNLRQYAASQKVIGGAWLQVVLQGLANAAAISEHDYLLAIGILGAMRHDHVWLNGSTLIGILTLDDGRAWARYEAVLPFLGGPKAEMRSHLAVASDFMRLVWTTRLPRVEMARAIGKLIEQIVRSRPLDWKAMLHVLDRDLDFRASRGDSLARQARDYLESWIRGHFYDIDEIRSRDRVFEGTAEPKSMRFIKSGQSRLVDGRKRRKAS